MGNGRVVEDFDDLGAPISFKFDGKIYEVPVPTPKTSKTLMKMGRDIQFKAKVNEKKVKELEELGEEIPEELTQDMDKLFDFQLDFILSSGIREINDDGSKKDVLKNYMESNFPNKLISRIFRKINENFTESEQEKKS